MKEAEVAGSSSSGDLIRDAAYCTSVVCTPTLLSPQQKCKTIDAGIPWNASTRFYSLVLPRLALLGLALLALLRVGSCDVILFCFGEEWLSQSLSQHVREKMRGFCSAAVSRARRKPFVLIGSCLPFHKSYLSDLGKNIQYRCNVDDRRADKPLFCVLLLVRVYWVTELVIFFYRTENSIE